MKTPPPFLPVLLGLALSLGCAGGWPSPGSLGSDEARAEARARAKAALRDPGADPADRETAAQLLGELGEPCPDCVPLLGRVLVDRRAPDALRARAAWSLGRLEQPDSAEVLIGALAEAEGELTAAYLLDALWSKEHQVFGDPELQADLAEGLNGFIARRGKRTPRTARALQARVATLPVSVRVLDRATAAWLEDPTAARQAILARAVRTVLRRLDEGLVERRRNPDAAWVEAREAVYFLQRAAVVGGPELRRRVHVALGQRAGEGLLAKAVADAFFGAEVPVPGRPTHAPRASERFIGAWLGERTLLTRPSVRAALHHDILLWESSPEVFRLLCELARARELELIEELHP